MYRKWKKRWGKWNIIYKIIGCDDTTSLEIELTDEEVKTFIKICKELNKKSSYGCQPTIALYKYDECEVEEDEYRIWVNTYYAEDLLEREEEDE